MTGRVDATVTGTGTQAHAQAQVQTWAHAHAQAQALVTGMFTEQTGRMPDARVCG